MFHDHDRVPTVAQPLYRVRQRLDVGRVASLDAPAALELGVELCPEEHRDVRDVQPDEEDQDGGEGAVDEGIGREVRDIEGEAPLRGFEREPGFTVAYYGPLENPGERPPSVR